MCYALLSHCAHCAWTKRITYPRCTHAEMHDLSPQTCPRRMRRRHERGGACGWCTSKRLGGGKAGVGEWDGTGVGDEIDCGVVGGGVGDGEDSEEACRIKVDYGGEVRSIPGKEKKLITSVVPRRQRIDTPARRSERKRGRNKNVTKPGGRMEPYDGSSTRVDQLLQEKKRKLSFFSGNVLDTATLSSLWTSARQDRRKSWCCALQGGSSLRRPSQHVVKDLMDGRLDQVRRASGVTIR